MPSRIAIIEGHPDPQRIHLLHALADAYAEGAKQAGHEIKRIQVATLDFDVLRTKQEWQELPAPDAIKDAQAIVAWADHLVILYPLWLGCLPALLKAFLEQLLRPGFAFEPSKAGGLPRKLLARKSARIVVTMGMPAFVYRWYFCAHSLKSLKRNILKFCGIGPIKTTLLGMVESGSNTRRQRWLARMRALGARTG